MNFRIVKMDESHIQSIAQIERECFSVPWSENALAEELLNPHARFFTALSDGEPIGYIGAFNVCGEGSVTNVAVSEKHRKKGVASALLNELTKTLEDEGAEFITLEVRASNSTAIRLYEKHGFVKCGLRKGFYSKPVEDAVLMKKELK